ncbi:O-antigen/teichoic acid export membrane protein [Thermosipho japonicus]|uniref:O-antigen/teichoic acid export membrane protein n=1 Tax=Thermosipho japonicus TaxID=90323 RepID=A0A841GLD5_9BACT|nr:oligosaccharide flippase family protein [Thermosipho japonicus]MBB6062805.1 O-antigen/teichoic acid export membrane protein [Thermosipho japonicus]
MNNKYKHLAKNTLWISLGTFGSKTISFFLLPIFTRVLNKTSYGKIDFFSTTISLLTIFLSFEIAAAVFRFAAESNLEKNKKILTSAYSVVFFSAIFFLLLFPLLERINSFFQQTKYYLFFSIVFSILSVINKNYLRAKEKMLVYATSDIINTFSFATFGILLVAVYKKDVIGYIQAYLLAQLITNIYLIIAGNLYKEISFKYVSKSMLKEMIKYSLPFVPNDLSWWIMNVSDRYLLIYFLGFAASGLYAVSYKFMALLSVLNGIFYQAWQVSAVKQYDKDDRDKFYSTVFYYLSSSLIIVLLLFSIIMRPFVKIMVGNEFEKAWMFLPFLMLGALFSSFSSFYGVGYIASKESKGAFTTSVYGALTNIGINIAFIPMIGAQAAAISTMVAFFVMWVLRLRQTRRYFKIKVNWKVLNINILLVVVSLFSNYIESYGIYIQVLSIILFILFNIDYIKSIFRMIFNYLKNVGLR